MRSDKAKNIAKVARVVLADPLLSRDEVAVKAWVSQWTASNVLAELKQEKWFLDEFKKVEQLQCLLSEQFKSLLSDEIVYDFITYCWNIYNAKDKIQSFILAHTTWQFKRKWIGENTRYWILERAWFKCQCCGAKPKADNEVELEIDHIVPHSVWWICHENNYQVLCVQCNSSKWNRFIFNHNKNEEG